MLNWNGVSVGRGVRVFHRIVFGAAGGSAAHAKPQSAHGSTRREAEDQGRGTNSGKPVPVERSTTANRGKTGDHQHLST